MEEPIKTAAYAYLAKARLYQAYEQDDNNKVISINPAKLQMVIDATNNVIGQLILNLISQTTFYREVMKTDQNLSLQFSIQIVTTLFTED